MILSFNKRFINKIKNGKKLHTIRRDEHNRWRAGRPIQMATGVRTKHYKQFGKGVCMSTQIIRIQYMENHEVRVFVDGIILTPRKVLNLANNDGFNSIFEFLQWFDKDFVGKIIHWTKKQY